MKPYATSSKSQLGRSYSEKPSSTNFVSDFKVDIHRILNSKAFRRLKGKTQVVTATAGDHFRDRLTHTIQVAHTAQILADMLEVNQDLAKAIALAHDLGHTPFGHSGEDTMNAILQEHGMSFEHNLQSLKVVSQLEQISPLFNGLNLHHETLLGLQKHDRFITLPCGSQASHSLEAQLVNEADEITYLYHDLDDANRYNLLVSTDLTQLKIYQLVDSKTTDSFAETILKFYMFLISDLAHNTKQNLKSKNIQTYQAVLNYKDPLVIYSNPAFLAKRELKQFLFERFWTIPSITQQREQGTKIINNLFQFFYNNPKQLPYKYQLQIQNGESIIEVVKDYIAGMTDQYAKNTYIENALS